MVLSAALTGSDWQVGKAELTIRLSETEYDCCLPVSALHSDNGGDFVYSVEERNTILGLQNIVRKVYVEVVERNNELAALRNYTTGGGRHNEELAGGRTCAYSGMKIRKAVLLLACAVSWGIAVWFAGRLWAAYPLVSVRSDVPVTGRQLEALRSALRQEDGASALVPAFWSQAEGSAESRWETCGITAILYCGEYDAVYPAVLLEGRFPAAQENGKCAVSTAAAWQLWGSEDVLGQELEIEGDIYRVCGLFRSSASLALCGESLDHGFSNIEFWGGYAAPPHPGRPGAQGVPKGNVLVCFGRRFSACARPARPATVAPALDHPRPVERLFLLGRLAARSGQSHRNRLFPEPLCQGCPRQMEHAGASHCRNARQCCGRKTDAQQAAKKLHKFMKPIHLILRIIFVR